MLRHVSTVGSQPPGRSRRPAVRHAVSTLVRAPSPARRPPGRVGRNLLAAGPKHDAVGGRGPHTCSSVTGGLSGARCVSPHMMGACTTGDRARPCRLARPCSSSGPGRTGRVRRSRARRACPAVSSARSSTRRVGVPLAGAARSAEKTSHDRQRPASAHCLQRPGGGTVLVRVRTVSGVAGHRPRAEMHARVRGATHVCNVARSGPMWQRPPLVARRYGGSCLVPARCEVRPHGRRLTKPRGGARRPKRGPTPNWHCVLPDAPG